MAYHTDDFLRKRQDDPKWRDAYLERRSEKRLIVLFWTIFIGGTAAFYLIGTYTDLYDIEEIFEIIRNKADEIFLYLKQKING